MTLQLELGAIQDPVIRAAFEFIAQRFPLHAQDFSNEVLLLSTTGTKRKIAYGASTCTWTASADSATTTIAHGLGASPVWEGFTASGTGALLYSLSSKDATNIVVVGRDTRGTALTGTFNFDWVAIG